MDALDAASRRLSALTLSKMELERELAPHLQRLDRLRMAELEAIAEYKRVSQGASEPPPGPPTE